MLRVVDNKVYLLFFECSSKSRDQSYAPYPYFHGGFDYMLLDLGYLCGPACHEFFIDCLQLVRHMTENSRVGFSS